MVIGLNPSTADETNDDPTVRRCIGYARSWGFGGLLMTNLFAFRATDPRDLKRAPDPSGPGQLASLRASANSVLADNGAVLAAWGIHGSHQGWADRARAMLIDAEIPVACLGLTRSGEPRHPLYLRADAVPVVYLGDGGRLVTPGLPLAIDG
jgi:hypothetical protein